MSNRIETRRSPIVWATLLAASVAAHAEGGGRAHCGTARPALDAIKTAEGLVIAPDGTIYFSQPFVGENTHFLGRYRPPYDHGPEIRWVDMGGDALGLALDPTRGVLYAGSRTLKRVLAVSLDDPPSIRTLAEAEEGINGLTLGEDGAVYYSDQAGGHLYRVTPEGGKTRVTSSPLVEPNGLAFAPDGRIDVVSWAGPEVFRLTVKDGVEQSRELFATLPVGEADGIAFDSRGRVYVTASSTLYQISPDGKSIDALGPAHGANIDFGAGALSCSDMYVAGNDQGIFRYEHDARGRDVPWHRSAGRSRPTP